MPPNLSPLPLEPNQIDGAAIGGALPELTHAFSRYNPLAPTPIALIDPLIRSVLAEQKASLPNAPRHYILTQITAEAAAIWLKAQPTPAATFYHTPLDNAAVEAWRLTCHNTAARTWQHGVFMEVAGSGVLITGDSGIGKSELALELLSRGHRLIADDAPYFVLGKQGIEGHCPENIRDLLEVRGLGIINVRDLFGANALKYRKNLRLVIALYPADHTKISAESRLNGERGTLMICQQAVPLFRLPIAPGRNIAVFVETVVRQHNLERSGRVAPWLAKPEMPNSAATQPQPCQSE